MNLQTLLTSLPGERTLENARAWLLEEVVVPNTERVTTTTIMARLTPAQATEVFTILHSLENQNALVKEALFSLRNAGLDLSHDNARTMLDTLFSPTLAAVLKALGEKTIPRWRLADIDDLKEGYIIEVLMGDN